MKVMCVKKPTITNDGYNHPSPDVGDKDVVVEERIRGGRVFFVLQRFDKRLSYLSVYFAILPDESPEEVTEEETLLQTA